MLKPETTVDVVGPENSGVPALHLQIKPDLAEVSGAALSAEKFLRQHQIIEEDATAVRIALAEALNNAVQYTTNRAQPVELDLRLAGDTLKACVVDHTPGFDLPASSELPDPDAESGRGIFILRTVMDSVEYSRHPEANRLVMTKRLKRNL